MGLLNRFDPSRERLKLPNLKKPSGFLKNLKSITLPLPSLLVPTPFTKGEGGVEQTPPPPSYLKNRCPHEREILQRIRDTFESLRNVNTRGSYRKYTFFCMDLNP